LSGLIVWGMMLIAGDWTDGSKELRRSIRELSKASRGRLFPKLPARRVDPGPGESNRDIVTCQHAAEILDEPGTG